MVARSLISHQCETMVGTGLFWRTKIVESDGTIEFASIVSGDSSSDMHTGMVKRRCSTYSVTTTNFLARRAHCAQRRIDSENESRIVTGRRLG
ncbi:hypothetical protein RERY_58810 [Rhodococcus erythropolis]|nr:hypothetical protein RERY_58810 [Rhodococcus erythropolis]